MPWTGQGVLGCRHGPGTWRVKAAGCHAPGTWPRKPHLGAVFGASREVPSSAVFLPQCLLFPLSPALRSEVYTVKIRMRFLKSRLKKKDYFHVVLAA